MSSQSRSGQEKVRRASKSSRGTANSYFLTSISPITTKMTSTTRAIKQKRQVCLYLPQPWYAVLPASLTLSSRHKGNQLSRQCDLTTYGPQGRRMISLAHSYPWIFGNIISYPREPQSITKDPRHYTQETDIQASPTEDILRARQCTRVYTVVYTWVYCCVHTCILIPPSKEVFAWYIQARTRILLSSTHTPPRPCPRTIVISCVSPGLSHHTM